MTIKYSRQEGWDESVLFQYAKRNLVAAEILFQNQNIETYMLSISSAGYLCHLGIELLLKGCWLYEYDYFENKHDLLKLVEKIGFITLDDRLNVFLSNIQLFNEMRYPQDLALVKVDQDADINANLPEEIGDHDWVGTIELLHEIQNQMPADLREIARPIFASFTNTLEEGKYLKDGYLYKLVLHI